MIILLDTSVIIDIENARRSALDGLSSLRSSYPEPPKISFITYFEFIFGLRKTQPEKRQKSLAFIGNFEVLQTTKTTAEILSSLKERYELPLSDLFIAAQAIENSMVLVTKDRDFERIKELNKVILDSGNGNIC